jgi:hypothetical protein
MLYKNWPEICKLNGVNPLLMIGIATLDLSKSKARAIVTALPQFFVDHETRGPVPLSVLKQKEMELCSEQKVYYISEQVADMFGIPTITLGFESNCVAPIPAELEGKWESMKDTVEWKGQRFVVLMDQSLAGELILAPTECVDLES